MAINGFGRIGRCLARIMVAGKKDLKLAAINSRADITRDVHLCRYDSVHGHFRGAAFGSSHRMLDLAVHVGCHLD
jgi:glyceraldehyde 3-phosphate dehydrogenase